MSSPPFLVSAHAWLCTSARAVMCRCHSPVAVLPKYTEALDLLEQHSLECPEDTTADWLREAITRQLVRRPTEPEAVELSGKVFYSLRYQARTCVAILPLGMAKQSGLRVHSFQEETGLDTAFHQPESLSPSRQSKTDASSATSSVPALKSTIYAPTATWHVEDETDKQF